MSNVRVDISGYKELSSALGELTVRMADAAARKAVRAAARPVITQARANLSAIPFDDSTGLLKRSVGVKVKKYRGRKVAPSGLGFVGSARTQRMYAAAGITMAIIGPRKGFGSYVNRRYGWDVEGGTGTRMVYSDPVKYGHLIEGGVAPHHIGKGSSRKAGVYRGAMHPGFRGWHWLETAINSKRSECQAIMLRVFRDALAQEAARARSKTSTRRAA